MSKLILITGGARSGKSIFAESTAKSLGEKVLYVATSIPFDDEMKMRVKKHREQRPKHWETVEAYKDIHDHIKPLLNGKSTVLVDCITVMITNILFERHTDFDNLKSEDYTDLEASVNTYIVSLINFIKGCEVPFILVTNEVGMGLVPDTVLGRLFRDIAGRANQKLAEASDEVYFCVSGIPVRIK
jgi:adenosylcobinamide kinase/adenosylcobinamide-phosphate guanylyltransferase